MTQRAAQEFLFGCLGNEQTRVLQPGRQREEPKLDQKISFCMKKHTTGGVHPSHNLMTRVKTAKLVIFCVKSEPQMFLCVRSVRACSGYPARAANQLSDHRGIKGWLSPVSALLPQLARRPCFGIG